MFSIPPPMQKSSGGQHHQSPTDEAKEQVSRKVGSGDPPARNKEGDDKRHGAGKESQQHQQYTELRLHPTVHKQHLGKSKFADGVGPPPKASDTCAKRVRKPPQHK